MRITIVISQDTRLDRIASRIKKTLTAERAAPFASLQYQFSEVGPAFTRLDPRELRAVLRLIKEDWIADEASLYPITEPLREIFALVDGPVGHQEHAAELAAATKEDQLKAWAAEVETSPTQVLADRLLSEYPPLDGSRIEENREEHLGGSANWLVPGVRVSIATPQARVCVWITNEIEWLYPDDPRLWRHILHAHSNRERPLIIARKIAVSSFPLLKRLGAFGIQLHHLYVPLKPESDLAKRALISGPLYHEFDHVNEHLAVEKLIPEFLRTQPVEHVGVKAALQSAVEVGLHQDSTDNRITALRCWADATELAMPPRWKAQITRYQQWARLKELA